MYFKRNPVFINSYIYNFYLVTWILVARYVTAALLVIVVNAHKKDIEQIFSKLINYYTQVYVLKCEIMSYE